MASRLRKITGIAALFSVVFAMPSFAQTAPANQSATDRAFELNTAPNPGTNDVLNLSSTLRGAIIDLPTDSLGAVQGASLFDLDLSGGNLDNSPATLDYTRAFNAGAVAGIDIELEPRANLRFSDEDSSALVGAIVRIGDDLREDGKVKKNTWYLFAGADAEAMTYAPGSTRNLTSGELGLQDRVIVGDAQAGIGYRLGSADVSLGYYHREVSSIEDNNPNNDFNISEDAAAISFTWRR